MTYSERVAARELCPAQYKMSIFQLILETNFVYFGPNSLCYWTKAFLLTKMIFVMIASKKSKSACHFATCSQQTFCCISKNFLRCQDLHANEATRNCSEAFIWITLSDKPTNSCVKPNFARILSHLVFLNQLSRHVSFTKQTPFRWKSQRHHYFGAPAP